MSGSYGGMSRRRRRSPARIAIAIGTLRAVERRCSAVRREWPAVSSMLVPVCCVPTIAARRRSVTAQRFGAGRTVIDCRPDARADRIAHGRRRKSGRGRSAGRRHRACHHAGGADGRPVADRDRARIPGARLAFDRERTPHQARQCAAHRRHAQAALQLLPHRLAAGRQHAGEHQGGRRDRGAAAPSAAFAAGGGAALRAQLLRPSRRPCRRRADRCADRARPPCPERRGRRGDSLRRAAAAAVRCRAAACRRTAGACSASRASTGASAATT